MYLASLGNTPFVERTCMYYFIFGLTYLFSLLPLWLLYRLSDGLYFLLYYLTRYRKNVVFANLEQAFPEKTTEERIRIAKKFYRNLADLVVEMIKMMSISKRQIKKRFRSDTAVFQYLQANKRSFQIHLGHLFNWEWANLYIRLLVDQPFLVTYMPLKNKAFNRLMKYLRSRFGSVLIPATDVLNAMRPWKGDPYISVLVADQNPGKVRRSYWFPFMNEMTAFYKGPELNARRNDHAVVFGNIKKVKRGYYEIETKLVFEHPEETALGEITEAFVKFLGDAVYDQPENWLWSHRRWKHTWKGEVNK